MMQGIATSIDALSVGFTTAGYGLVMAVVCSLIVAVVTFVICETGLCLGKTLGTKLSGKADVLGGVILIGIGIVSWDGECDFLQVRNSCRKDVQKENADIHQNALA